MCGRFLGRNTGALGKISVYRHDPIRYTGGGTIHGIACRRHPAFQPMAGTRLCRLRFGGKACMATAKQGTTLAINTLSLEHHSVLAVKFYNTQVH